jgi:ketosteroid isomerase-like protein
MSQENVEAFKRGLEAGNRHDFDAMLEELDPEVEWHPATQAMLGGEATVFRGREEVRKGFQDLVEAFDDLRFEVSEFRDLGDELLAFGRCMRMAPKVVSRSIRPWPGWSELRTGRRFGFGATWIPRKPSKPPG